MKKTNELKSYVFLLSLLLLVLFAQPLQADTVQKKLYRQAGLDLQFESLWREISAEYAALPKRETNADLEQRIHSYIESSFAESKLQKHITEFWKVHLSASEIKTVSAWLSSPIGRRLTQAEIHASTGESNLELNEYLESLRRKPPSRSRIELLRLLERTVNASGLSTDLGIQINLAAVVAQHVSGQAPNGAPTPSAKSKSLEDSRKLIQVMMRQDIMRYNLYTYRNFSNSELREYISFAQSAVGSHFHSSTFFATREALQSASKRLRDLLQAEFQHVNMLY